ncbi:beta-galactosidase [Dyadobacter psychrophilus]|uniref:Por secretion system C-terminal sorting domain-containing protein n=1 Tax=Dyadobacter psychrophilus TaxID=651661 RepID=A0A1T5C6C4_9BACT|nr:beta-galactosidase [Dyadobacter psychrophilus]SKB54984.1 Por secretion system C-terminal sorting domain-containing protein [Dyadobacter psychrophilus]
MKKRIFVNWQISTLFFSFSLFFVPLDSSAQQPRYFAVSLVNENDSPSLTTIQSAKDIGCNAVALTIQWGTIEGKISRILKAENGPNYNVWKQYDDQINLATSLGMKVAINIAISTGDDVTNGISDRYGVDTGDGWKKEDRVMVANYNGQEAVFQKQGGPIRPNINLQFVMTSLAAQSTRDRITAFATKVIQRYKYVQEQNNLLYVSLIYSRQGEGEFEMGSTKYHYEQPLDMSGALTDYSAPMTNAYRNWLKGKYGHIEYLNSAWGTNHSSFNNVGPKRPSNTTFTGADGTDWFAFRTQVLKDVNNLFKNTVKGIDSNIKVLAHHGSVYDKLSRSRGTLPFNEIGAELDGVKINDDIFYDHRFAIDLVRSNLPGKIYVNEAAYVTGTQSIVNLTTESYTHGAQIVTLFYLENALKNPDAVNTLKSLTSQWVKNKNVTTPTATSSDNFTLSSMIDNDGCYTQRDSYANDCEAYKKWRSTFDNGGGKPVSIMMQNNVVQPGCFYKDLSLATNGAQAASIIPDGKYFHLTGPDCKLIGTVKGNGLTNGNDKFKATVTVDPQVTIHGDQPLVQRHFKLVPGGTNPGSASVTLYVSQDELTAFNVASSEKLPVNSSDNASKANLRVLQWKGDMTSGSPDVIIDPNDNDIQWDATLNLWRIRFEVNGFSTFYISAHNAGQLPVTLVNFSGKKQENAVSLDWQTSEETNSDHFEIQHGVDGKQWTKIGEVAASAESKVLKTYNFIHPYPSAGENLYRLKMVDQDNTFAYSKIISAGFETLDRVTLYPNPVTAGVISLQYTGTAPKVTLNDITGRNVPVMTEQDGPDKLTVRAKARLTPGLYILNAGYGATQVRHKVVVN